MHDEEDKAAAARARKRRDRTVVLACVAAVAAMGALSYAAVPLYRMWCQTTGFGGTTQKAAKAPDVVFDRIITVRFDANVAPDLPWSFEPVQRTVDVKVGENALAFYKAANLSDHAITGAASFNVAPDVAGIYFSKIQCFCFKEQRLGPGEKVEMGVSFFIDPSMMNDREALAVREITLSYTFYPVSEPKGPLASEASSQSGKGG
jgi:cytochrome c oxidase assembly protein subunit 11